MNKGKAVILLIAVSALCFPANSFARKTDKQNHYHVDKTWKTEANGSAISDSSRKKEAKKDLKKVICAKSKGKYKHKYVLVGIGDKSCPNCTQHYFKSVAKQNPGYTVVSSNVFENFMLLKAMTHARITNKEFVPATGVLLDKPEDNAKRKSFCSKSLKAL